MHTNWKFWGQWGQARARANARLASTELARARVQREEVDSFLVRHLDDGPRAMRA